MPQVIGPSVSADRHTEHARAGRTAVTGHDKKTAPILGVDEYGSIFIMSRGAAASYFRGEWKPGIIWEGRDLMNFSKILDAQEIEVLMAQADSALRASLLPRDTD
jgi:hypothetical protein